MRVTLRAMAASDIEDNVRWFTKDTEWADMWDSPWEEFGDVNEDNERKNWTEYYERVKDRPFEQLNRLEVMCDDEHVGWVSRYYDLDYIDNPEHIAAIGIDLPEQSCRGKGVGTEALRQYIEIHKKQGHKKLFIQTWSGNYRMIHVMEKLGFKEYYRKAGFREVRGEKYDAVTYLMVLE